jgi:hypothetical protein
MRHAPVAYEPAFGAIVFVLAAATFCFALFAPRPSGTSHTGTVFLFIFSVQGMFWGVGQIVGYRREKRLLGNAAPAPLLGAALGCVFFGLMLALVALLFYYLAPNHPLYTALTGGASALLLVIGAVAGVREGVWRGDP